MNIFKRLYLSKVKDYKMEYRDLQGNYIYTKHTDTPEEVRETVYDRFSHLKYIFKTRLSTGQTIKASMKWFEEENKF